MATKVACIAQVNHDNQNRGIVSAYVLVQVKNFHGMDTFKRVRVAVEYGVDVDTAKNMMQSMRDNNEPNSILGRFTMNM